MVTADAGPCGVTGSVSLAEIADLALTSLPVGTGPAQAWRTEGPVIPAARALIASARAEFGEAG